MPSLEFALSEAAEPLPNGRHRNTSSKRKAKAAFSKQKWMAQDQSMCAVLNWLLLTDPTGIAIGPDSDGLLNFCDNGNGMSGPTEAAVEAAESSAVGELSLLFVPESKLSFVC